MNWWSYVLLILAVRFLDTLYIGYDECLSNLKIARKQFVYISWYFCNYCFSPVNPLPKIRLSLSGSHQRSENFIITSNRSIKQAVRFLDTLYIGYNYDECLSNFKIARKQFVYISSYFCNYCFSPVNPLPKIRLSLSGSHQRSENFIITSNRSIKQAINHFARI